MRHLLIPLALLAGVSPALARIKMTALPRRERVEIQLDHARYTLVEEERIVPLLRSTPERGNNFVDFSWSNARIDKDSIQFRPLAVREGDGFRALEKGEVSVVNVGYPPSENALVWEIHAKRACAVKARVSYLIAYLDRSFSYRAKADKEERFLVLRKYLQLRNYSGEEYGDAGIWAGFGPKFTRPVEQQTDIRMLLDRFEQVPIEKTFTFDWYANGRLNAEKPFASRILIHYVLINGKKQNLGRFPLQPGKVRIFLDDGHGGEAFLGEDWAGLTPIDGEMRLFLGEARDIVCTRTIQRSVRHAVRGNRFDQELVIRYECENFRKGASPLRIVEQLNELCRQYAGDPHGDVEWELGAETTEGLRLTYENGRATPVLHVDLAADPGAKQTFVLHVTLKNIW